MRHGYFGRNLSRTTDERKRLLRGLARELIVRGQIKTTLAKAKAVRPLIEKLVTRAKKDKGDTRHINRILADKAVAKKLSTDAETRFAKRESGFTRIFKIGPRHGDATEEALLMFVDEEVKTEVLAPNKEKKVELEKTKAIRPIKKTVQTKTKTKK